ncbi:hypothetical protein BGW42_008418 [Actinomortierella wolfii]|nr:hypothetical protein BGW42_008418 [Actinomortierella wolfii]
MKRHQPGYFRLRDMDMESDKTDAHGQEAISKHDRKEIDSDSSSDEAVNASRLVKRRRVQDGAGQDRSASGLYLDTIQRHMLDFDFEKYVLDPRFTPEQVANLDKNTSISYDLHRKQYIPGFIGLNKIKANDYMNVVLQVLAHVPPIRNYFMLEKLDERSELVKRFGTLVRKIWNPAAFKGQVSPHELLQEISNASNRKFRLTEQGDPLAFMSWFLNTLHRDLGGTRKKDSSIIHKTFQGELKIETQKIEESTEKDRINGFDLEKDVVETKSPFLLLTLDLPPPPLFHDEQEKDIIPQIPLQTILAKYDGNTYQESVADLKRFNITRLPNYLIFHIKRFSKNDFMEEKNPTIVTFPIKNLSMEEFVQDPTKEVLGTSYDLLANITHEGDPSVPNSTAYKVHLQHRAKEQWYQIQDLFVEEINAQMIFLSESYIQEHSRKRDSLRAATKKFGNGEHNETVQSLSQQLL